MCTYDARHRCVYTIQNIHIQSAYAHMGWLQLVGSIKFEVSFAKETYKRDDILQKRPIILSILLTVATPYSHIHTHIYVMFILQYMKYEYLC